MSPQMFENFRIVNKLGEGGMSAVYEAVQIDLGASVALKVVSPELTQDADLVRRFLNEARALSALQHPGVVRLYDYGRLADGTMYLVLELLRGESLHQRLRRLGGQLSLAEALCVSHQVACTLADIHERGLVHRDIKPANVILMSSTTEPPEAQVKLVDFGLVKLLEESGLDSATELHTRDGLRVGTPEYMSPEQCRGEPIGPKTDVYGLGAMIFRLLAGAAPFSGPNVLSIFAQQMDQPAPSLASRRPEVPAALDALVAAMLSKNPRRRPTMRQVAKRLRALHPPTRIHDPVAAEEISIELELAPDLDQEPTHLITPPRWSRWRRRGAPVLAALTSGGLLLVLMAELMHHWVR